MHSERLKLTVKGQTFLHCVKDVSLKTVTYLHPTQGILLTFIDSYQTIFCLLTLNLTEDILQIDIKVLFNAIKPVSYLRHTHSNM